LVVCEPFAVFAPVTENRTTLPALGVPALSLTVAVTQCCEPTVFVAVAGESESEKPPLPPPPLKFAS
jgi:hypothetical protein